MDDFDNFAGRRVGLPKPDFGDWVHPNSTWNGRFGTDSESIHQLADPGRILPFELRGALLCHLAVAELFEPELCRSKI